MENDDLTPHPPKLLREGTDQTLQNPPDASSHETTAVTLFKKHGRLRLQLHQPQQQLKNNLLAGVGYLELSNGGDFAANVWNQIPVPTYAVVLMAIGAVVALLVSLFALWDFRLSWRNLRLLREERERLRRGLVEMETCSDPEKNGEVVRILRSRLGVNDRELGTEVIDRLGMDVLVGLGSVLVGVGTLMAIWGANHTIFKTSNLLSGYLGNSFTSLFGLVNGVWSGYLIFRFHRHGAAAIRDPSMAPFGKRLRLRFRRLKCHAFVNGLNGLVAGAASMVTATKWWGYVMLIPCIVSSIFFNYYWRWKIGYDRPLWNGNTFAATGYSLLGDVEYVTSVHTALIQSPISLPMTVADTNSFESMLDFIVNNAMFEYFCEWMVKDGGFLELFPAAVSERAFVIITPRELAKLSADDNKQGLLLDKSRRFLHDVGHRIFGYRERYLLEVAGYAFWSEEMMALS